MSGKSVFSTVRLITLACITIVLLNDGNTLPGGTTGLAVLLITLGIPHGAADHLIFRSRNFGGKLPGFFLFYLLLILAYALLWHLLPAAAFLLFLLVSIHHFGQSYTELSNRSGNASLHLLWGAFVLLFPVLHHFQEAGPIIGRMIGIPLDFPAYLTTGVAASLPLAFFLYAFLRFRRKELDRSALIRAVTDLSLLLFLYLNTDLLLGFALYFLVWHSLPAAAEQWAYLSRHQLSTTVGHYLGQLLPLSLGAVLTIGLFYFRLYDPQQPVDLGLLFIFVSLITLPHAFLVDHVYR